MVHLFLWKRHVATWGILLQMIWMTMKIYVANWDVFYGRSNMLLRTFGACSYIVKLLLFMSYCGSLYTSSIWCKYTKKQYYQMEVVYNNVFRRFFDYDRFSSASQMFVENRAENFETRMRRLIYGFRERLNASRNSLVICLMNSVAWSSSGLRQKWEKCLYM